MSDTGAVTLREGLARLRDRNAAVFADRDATPEAQQFFRCHDVAHVVFGCDTSFFGEGVLKIFTIFGTTLGLRGHLSGYAEAGAFELFQQYRMRQVAKQFIPLLLAIPRVSLRARRMRRPWPWDGYDAYMDQTLDAIRGEFNIAIVPRR